MAIDVKIRDENLQYDINGEPAKISELFSSKFDKYECLTGEEILPFGQSKIKKKDKFIYSPFGKAFKKPIKTIENQGEKQIKAIAEHGKQLAESNALQEKNDCDTKKDSQHFCSKKMTMKGVMKYHN